MLAVRAVQLYMHAIIFPHLIVLQCGPKPLWLQSNLSYSQTKVQFNFRFLVILLMEVLKHSHCLEPHSSSFEAGFNEILNYFILTLCWKIPVLHFTHWHYDRYTSTEKICSKLKLMCGNNSWTLHLAQVCWLKQTPPNLRSLNSATDLEVFVG